MRVHAAALAVIGLVVLWAAVARAESADAVFEAGKVKFAAGDFKAAAELFKRAYAIEKSPSYVYSEGSAHRRLSEWEAAALAYEEYLRIVPPADRPDERPKAIAYAADMRLRLGITLKEAGRCADAIPEFIHSLEHAPTAGAPWVYLGLCREDIGDKKGAQSAYERALAVKELEPALRTAAEARLAVLRPPAALDAPPETAPAHKKTPVALYAGIGGGLVAVAIVTVIVVLVAGGPRPVDVGDPSRGVMTQEGW
ncbi:MAG TPA: tetratricopeptide repeat protein [Myxococcota bacterium]|jgi:tetratricopeptide (TPR) repeat protein|nr:tetratricopeptide repeat protein [Myxococcota bacterium]